MSYEWSDNTAVYFFFQQGESGDYLQVKIIFCHPGKLAYPGSLRNQKMMKENSPEALEIMSLEAISN